MTVTTVSAEQFAATPHATADEKAKAANALMGFIEAGCPWKKFSNRVYSALHLNLFGHIAHFDRSGFYHVWFSTPERRVRFLEHALDPSVSDPENGVSIAVGHRGQPELCWVDVEWYLARWIAESGALTTARAERDADHEVRERAELIRLTAKYGSPSVDTRTAANLHVAVAMALNVPAQRTDAQLVAEIDRLRARRAGWIPEPRPSENPYAPPDGDVFAELISALVHCETASEIEHLRGGRDWTNEHEAVAALRLAELQAVSP